VERIDLDGQALLTEDLQGFIHRVEGYGRKAPPHLLIDRFRVGMIGKGVERGQHRQALGSHGNPPVPQFFQEIFHEQLSDNNDYWTVKAGAEKKKKNPPIEADGRKKKGG
jgi:hypothetical protein